MTVKELEEILHSIENKELPIMMGGYCNSEANGYYFDKKDNNNVVVLTVNDVQPRTQRL